MTGIPVHRKYMSICHDCEVRVIRVAVPEQGNEILLDPQHEIAKGWTLERNGSQVIARSVPLFQQHKCDWQTMSKSQRDRYQLTRDEIADSRFRRQDGYPNVFLATYSGWQNVICPKCGAPEGEECNDMRKGIAPRKVMLAHKERSEFALDQRGLEFVYHPRLFEWVIRTKKTATEKEGEK
ncbi:hypothetical protein Mbo2_069 [Rhodococcus phage Mbo2]|uniref:DNA-binding phage zinc finger domain-containing protein n=1 Tax=Rhodococcus phage Mbo2 TaxID=2936911 RepID=A0A9E7LH60_9CAUD|nr:hypothetical protein Mbo2_069 [Rhodococcus phage Mbo2]